MTSLLYCAAAIIGCLGFIHLIYAIRDAVGPPRYFRPTDQRLRDAMRDARTAVAPQGQDFWSGIIGFHLSHAIGVLLFSLLITLAAAYDIAALKPALILIGMTYAAISYRWWFSIPTIGISAATVILMFETAIRLAGL